MAVHVTLSVNVDGEEIGRGVDHPDGASIYVQEGHLFVSRLSSGPVEAIAYTVATYAPGTWVRAEVRAEKPAS